MPQVYTIELSVHLGGLVNTQAARVALRYHAQQLRTCIHNSIKCAMAFTIC